MKTLKNILLINDGGESGGGSVPPAPLDTGADLMNYDNSMVLIDPGTYNMKCIETELKANNAKTIMLTLTNVETVRSTKGDIVNAGEGRVFCPVNTCLTGKMKPKMLNDGCSFVIQAFARPGVTSIDGLQQNHSLLKGEMALVQLVTEPAGIKSDQKHHEASTKVAKWYKKGTMPGQ